MKTLRKLWLAIVNFFRPVKVLQPAISQIQFPRIYQTRTELSPTHPALDLDKIPHYYVQAYKNGSPVLVYSGDSGRDYRQAIEGLRRENSVFHGWLAGAPHDWGPR